jgi:hypothetical protein
MPRPGCRAWPARRGCAGNPTAGFSCAGRTASRAIPRDRRRAAGPASCAGVVFPGGEPAVPGQQCRRGYREDPGPAAPRDEPGQRGEPGAVTGLVPYPAGVPAQYRVLVPEHQQLGVLRPVPADHHGSQAEQPAHQRADDLEQHQVSQPSPPVTPEKQAGQRHDRVSGRHRLAVGAGGYHAVGAAGAEGDGGEDVLG